jgi:uncharacterized iron-regulated membrane protein
MSVITRKIHGLDDAANLSAAYRVVWRWHFYAGLFSLPFVLVLALSGIVYLFKPQIDAALDRPYDHLALNAAPQSLDAQVAAAQAAMPDARLASLELRADRADAARVAFMRQNAGGAVERYRVFVRPDTLEILEIQNEDHRPTEIAVDIHGNLMLGASGHIAMELAGSWAIVMIVTGLYLWWPRGSSSLAGVLYPRISAQGRTFWRDLHAVTGVWISLFAMFLLVTGLPWTTVWGKSFEYARSVGEKALVHQDWTTGPDDKQQQEKEKFEQAAPAPGENPHAQHNGAMGAAARTEAQPIGFDRIAPLAAQLDLAPPTFIKPPSPENPKWIVESKTQNRPLRQAVEFNAMSLEQIGESGFATSSLTDRIFLVGIAAHEGQLFGWFNQLLGLLTALGYLALVVSAAVMWWRRRPRGALGAPPAYAPQPKLAPFVIGVIALLGLFLPTLGLSLLLLVAAEQLIRRYAPGPSRWLGLRATR